MRYIRISAVLLLLACGDGGTTPTSPPTPPTPPAPVATSVTLSVTSLSFASLGDTSPLSATVKDQNGATMSGASVSWSTSSASVATVSSAGLVTAVSNGSATITATSGSAKGTATATVAQVAATLALSKDSLTFSVIGDTLTLTASGDDAGGSTLADVTVTWSSSDSTIATVSDEGLVAAVSESSATITATSGTLTATATVTIDLGDVVVSITSVDPTIWTEGQQVTINGSGFGATPSSNTITVDGMTASITSASATQLQITVPTAACKPSRETQLVVKVAADSATSTVGVKPGSVWELNAGTVLYNIGGDCLHLAGGSGSEKYIVGVLSASESATSLTPYTQTAIAGTTLAGDAAPDFPVAGEGVGYAEVPINAFGDRGATGPAPLQQFRRDPDEYRRSLAHAESEARRWELWRQTVDEMALRAPDFEAADAVARAPLTARSVGDTIEMKVHTGGSTCTDTANGGTGTYTTITTIVTHIGTSAIYMEDIGNPLTESFTTAEYADLDATLSGTTLPTIKNYFGDFWTGTPRYGVAGDELGLDADGRVGVVITKAVNEQETKNGFVSPADLYATSYCPKSNQAEAFYGVAPDPDGVHEYGAFSKADALALYPRLMSHEITHILQKTQETFRVQGWTGWKAVWETEGGAVLAEQLSGNAALSHGGSGKNLGETEFLEGYYAKWYQNWTSDLRAYFGWGSDGTVAGAPEECTWLDRKPPGPCGGGDGEWTRSVYGVPGTLLRFILDEYGPSYTGGEAALMSDLTVSSEIGYNNLVTTTGASSIGYLLTMFGATLWSDGRVWNSLTSWDLRTIMDLWAGTNGKLQPYTSSDAEPTSSHSVRGGSTAYLEWSPPSSHAPTSLRIRTPDGDELPDEMSFWILRIQ